MNNEACIVIDRPIEEVFRLTTEHVAEWSIIVIEDTVVEDKPGGVGTKFRTVTEEGGRKMIFQGEVVRWEPPHVSAVHMVGDMFDIDAVYFFEDLRGKTRVTQKSNVAGKGFFKLFLTLFGWLMNKSSCKALDNELQSLKRFCEQQAAPAG